jgi:uncharacterized cupin superfamily protein
VISHWDEQEAVRRERGHIGATWTDLVGDATVGVGAQRVRIDPGMWSTPLHEEGSEEEIFFVLGGTGISLQSEDSAPTQAFEVGPGDCLVHLASRHAHTLCAGPEGLDILIFGERHLPFGSTRLPRAGVSWGLGAWVPTGDPEEHPWKREVEAGPPEVPESSPRSSHIVNVADVASVPRDGATIGRTTRNLGGAAGSQRSGLRLSEVAPGKLNAPPHCHSAEEEIFVVLDGSGALLLYEDDRVSEFPVVRGSVVARPPATGVAHAFRAGEGGLTLLMYGTREPNDICFYLRSGKISFRGVGVIGRLEKLDYWDGED